jgi:cytoskeletal protein CcmA (bactofilin family)
MEPQNSVTSMGTQKKDVNGAGSTGAETKQTGTTTVIGPSIVIRGKLKSDEDLVIRGRIDAEIRSSKALHVENSGIVKANLQVEQARISGVLVGNVTAESRVEIASDGRMVGDLLAPRIVISDGASFRGHIDMQSFDEARAEPPAAYTPVTTTSVQDSFKLEEHLPDVPVADSFAADSPVESVLDDSGLLGQDEIDPVTGLLVMDDDSVGESEVSSSLYGDDASKLAKKKKKRRRF